MSSLLAVASAGAFLCAAVLPPGGVPWSLAALCAVAVAALATRSTPASRLALFLLLAAAARSLLPPALQVWPFPALVPLLCFGGAAAAVPSLRGGGPWFAGRAVSGGQISLALAASVVSFAALGAWVLVAQPDLARYARHIPAMPPWAIPLAGLGFALFNAAMEEVSFRGIVFGALRGVFGGGPAPLVIQAVLFGALHYRSGFPSGVEGAAMTAAYGIVLGALRVRSGGLAVPWAVHAAADGAVFAILVRLSPPAVLPG